VSILSVSLPPLKQEDLFAVLSLSTLCSAHPQAEDVKAHLLPGDCVSGPCCLIWRPILLSG
jgi:hypothetical protein